MEMDYIETDEYDVLNEETFGDDDYGDWEADHDEYVKQTGFFDSKKPTPRDSKKEASKDVDLDKSFNLLEDIEQTIDRLVTDEVEYVDPAILDVSRRKFAGSNHVVPPPNCALFPSSQGSAGKIWDSDAGIASRNSHHTFGREPSTNGSGQTNKINTIDKILRLTQSISGPQLSSRENQNGGFGHPPSNIDAQTIELVQILDRLKLELLKTGQDVSSLDPQLLGRLKQHLALTNKAPQHMNVPEQRSNFPPPGFNPCTPPPNFSASYQRMPVERPLNQAHMMPFQRQMTPPVTGNHRAQMYPPVSNFGMMQAPPGFQNRPMAPSAAPSSISSNFPTSVDSFFDQQQPSPRYQPSMAPSYVSTQEPESSYMSEEEEVEFNAAVDDWMSDFQKNGILRFHQRTLRSTNPYVQDYYYTLRWVRQKTAQFNQMVSRYGQAATKHMKPPIFQLPAPLDATELYTMADSHPHMVNLKHKFVLTAEDAPEIAASMSAEINDNESVRSMDTTTSNLGRPTRSNFQTQRVIAELSVASVLTSPTKATSRSDSSSLIEDGLAETDTCSNATIRSTGTAAQAYFPGKSIYAATSVGYAPDIL